MINNENLINKIRRLNGSPDGNHDCWEFWDWVDWGGLR